MFEPKWNGYRAICYYDNGRVRFISRRNNDLSKRFPELQSIQVRVTSAIIDGEIVAIRWPVNEWRIMDCPTCFSLQCFITLRRDSESLVSISCIGGQNRLVHNTSSDNRQPDS